MFGLFIYILGWITFVGLILGGIGYCVLWFYAKMMGMPD